MKTKTKASPKDKTDWKNIATTLAQKVNFALQYLAPKGGGSGMVYNSTTGEMRHWRDGFADALEMIPGLEIDREAMHAMSLPKKQRDAFFKKRKAQAVPNA